MPPESRPPTPDPRPAFTLIELLVAMALTLILVYAIAHFYAIIGDAVKDGRAMIELNQQLRACVERLKNDLDSVTIPIVPWADEGGAAGYFEYREGLPFDPTGRQGTASDWDVNGNYRLDSDDDIPNNRDIWPPSNATPAGPDGRPDFNEPNFTNLLGDTDDILAMTIRSAGVPFSGQRLDINPATGLLNLNGSSTTPDKITNRPKNLPTTSPYAEAVWWTGFNDVNLNRTWDLNEPRIIHRRQLLIRPDLNVLRNDSNAPGAYYVKIPVTGASTTNIGVYDLYQYCDISMRPAGIGGGHVYFVANSLSDLCKRENRFMHNGNPVVGGIFPYTLDLNPNFAGDLRPNLIPDNQVSLGTTQSRSNPTNAFSQYRWALFDGGRKGEDVMLSNTLAFDIRVFDPEARVYSDSTQNPPPITAIAVQPGDAGYPYAVNNGFNVTGNSHSPFAILGTGAYVDLGYGIGLATTLQYLTPVTNTATGSNSINFSCVFGNTPPGFTNVTPYAPVIGNSRYANFPKGNNYFNILGFTYDTWTLLYERDGLDQNGNNLIDEGTNGIDDNNSNGVDDVSERETVPPYADPLRGIQVKIRVYEPNTRQARQATVESDFIPE